MPYKSYSYYPNIKLFNNSIAEWANSDIRFAGIFHTHNSYKEILSDADCRYINEIFNAMPNDIGVLYFPLLLIPSKRFIPFVASMNNSGIVEIVKDNLEIIT
jgi:hypothetical protein